MWYAIIGEDVENSRDLRAGNRSHHLARLEHLKRDGRLLLAGPHPSIDSEDPGDAGFTGSLIVAEFPSLEAATEWANADPYVSAGVFAKVAVKPFKMVLP